MDTTRHIDRRRLAARWLGALVGPLLLGLLLVAPGAHADDPLDPGAKLDRFTRTRWSMIVPDKDFEGGCVVGFLAFEFSPTGYFSFNNHVRGSWRVDELGNLKLRTRDGVRFTMLVDGNSMRPSQTIRFLQRTQVFERCPE